VRGGKGSLAGAKGITAKGIDKSAISVKTSKIFEHSSRAKAKLVSIHGLERHIGSNIPGTPEPYP
jgi:hypothetical protein